MANIPDNIVAILGVDNAGAITNIDPNLIFNKKVETVAAIVAEVAPTKKDKATETTVITNNVESTIALAITADSTNIPMVNKDQDNLENSVLWQITKKIGLNTKSPKWLLDLYAGSINITPSTIKDGYKIKSINFAYADFTTSGSEQVYFGDDSLLPIANFKKLLIRGLIPTSGTGIDRILYINDLGVVTAKENLFELKANKGVADGYASLDGTGKVPTSQLPSYVDAIVSYANLAAFPATGNSGTIYVALDTGKTYRWGGSSYVEIISSGVAWGAISGTLSSQGDLQTALNAKQNTLTAGAGISIATNTISSTITQYTDSLARASVSGGSGISYSSSTGVISYSGTVYSDSSIRGLVSAGSGISYNSSTGVISLSGTAYTDSSIRGLFSGGAGISYDSGTGAISSTITQYTDALAKSAISLTTTGTSGAATYNSTTGVINIPQYQGGVTSIIAGTGITISGATGAVTINSTGTVSSVAATSSIGLTITNSPITTSGTLVIGSINDDLRMRSLVVGSFTGLLLPNGVDGKIEASGDIVGFSSSDERLKEDIKVIDNATEKLSRIRGVKFNWKKEFEYLHGFEGADMGVIAQDVMEEFPEAIKTRETGYLAVRYEKLIGLLVAAVNEQSEEIKELKSKLK
jgi:hypothetical protein